MFELIRRLIRRLLSRLGIRSVGISVTPGSGPSGTTVTIEVSGGLARDPVTLGIGPGTTGYQTDANGELTVTDRIFGRPGDKVTIRAVVGTGGANDQTAETTFTVTE